MNSLLNAWLLDTGCQSIESQRGNQSQKCPTEGKQQIVKSLHFFNDEMEAVLLLVLSEHLEKGRNEKPGDRRTDRPYK